LTFWEVTFSGLIEDTIRVSPSFTLTAGARYYFQNFFHNDPNNLAPRFGFAWKPNANSKTVVRGGSGVFYDRTGPRPIADVLQLDGSRLDHYLINNPGFLTPPSSQQLTPSLVTLSSTAKIPYVVQWNLGVEQQIGKAGVLSLDYMSSRGIKLFRSIDLNTPLSSLAPRPDPAIGQLRVIDSEGRSTYDQLEFTYRGNITKWFTAQASYRLAKSMSNTDAVTFFPADSYHPNLDWGRSNLDQRHRFYVMGSSNLPHNLRLGTALRVASGMPYNITTGNDDNGDGNFNDRPAGVTRNSGHGPGSLNLDVKLNYDWHVQKKQDGIVVSTGISAFNVINHTNYQTPIGIITSPFFGQSVSAGAPRQLQLSASVRF
jgi:hypothetical protein